MDWNKAYRRAEAINAAINWDFLLGVVTLGALWAVILFGFSMVIG